MYCTNCGNQLQEQSNFCSRCGAKVAAGSLPAAAGPIIQNQETTAQKFWKRLGQATLLYLQQQAVMNAMRQQQSGDNFWSSVTACGNDNVQSGYVDVGGTIVGYDR
ncbi:MAG TPA: zinc ribbon domain-containing protein [Candidatus Acidoferrum sp.]|nr:zinc ribbon domain-containing protein [Candidatus Acidoferrum sp.]